MSETTHTRTVALLPWLVNGTLDPKERREVQEHLAYCAACHGVLAEIRGAFALYGTHLPATVLVQHAEAPDARLYGVGGLPVESRLVDLHLDHCDACRDELELTRQSFRSLRAKTAADDGETLATVTPFARPGIDDGVGEHTAKEAYISPRWLPMALAASLLLAVISAGGWGFTVQKADERNEAQRQEIAELEKRLLQAEEERRLTPEDGAALADLRRELERKLRNLEERYTLAEDRAETLDRQVAELSGGVSAAGVIYVPLEGGDVLRSTATPGSGEVPQIKLAGAGGILLQPTVRPDLLAAGDLAFRVLSTDGAVVAEGPLPVIDETAQGLGRYVSLYLPSARLPPGIATLELWAGGEEIGRYPFRVER